MKSFVVRCAWGAIAACVSGCSVTESLRVTSTVLVKVPDPEIHDTKASADGWHFRHVLAAPAADRSQWYVAWNNQRPLRTGFMNPYWMQLFARAPEIADATKQVLGFYPILLEPNRTFARFASKQGAEMLPDKAGLMLRDSATPLVYKKKPSSAWPIVRVSDAEAGLKFDPPGRPAIDPVWYLRDRYSQLASARERVGRPAPGMAIRIGHLDNGYDARHAGLPENLVKESSESLKKRGALSNAVGRLEYEMSVTREEENPGSMSAERLRPPDAPGIGAARASHGLGTIGILAGRRVTLPPQPGVAGYTGYLGGAPHAEIVPVRVAPWVVSLNTAELAYAIDYASREQHCDVISMSHGGAPTQAWADAVNAAYERGTAMFAAESDFFSMVGNPFRPAGIILPASPVYPAAFGRVVGVTGVTSRGGSYGKNDYWRLVLRPWTLLQWAARGSYGADGTSAVLYRPMRKVDPEQVKEQGELHAQPIAAYSPNIPWLAIRKEGGKERADALDLDGSGTSAATPQVAAAAALWLQKNRAEIERAGDWHSWKKAEAVYYALLCSAERGKGDRADFYLGAGTLKANRALDISYRTATAAKYGEDLRCVEAPLDRFDGSRSVFSFLGLGTLKHVSEEKRAHLWQQTLRGESRADALTRLYYNLGLLKEWHGGDLPEKDDQSIYWDRAKRRAANAPARR